MVKRESGEKLQIPYELKRRCWHPGAHYKPTDSKESPGLVGMSTQEIKDYGL